MENRPLSRAPLWGGVVILLAFGLCSLFPDWLAPHRLGEMFRPWQGPGGVHLLGTNDMGSDLATELVYAARSTLTVGCCAAAVSLLLGSLLGLLSGWHKGWLGDGLDLLTNIFLLIPLLPAAIVTAALLGPGMVNLILVIGLLGWCGTARAVRAQVQKLRRSVFVESLLLLGLPRWRILFRHLLPNLAPVIFSRFVLSVSACIMTEATLSFLGLGDPTRPTWGGMVSMAYQRGGFARGAVWWFAAPGLCILLTTLAFGMIGHYFEQKGRMVEGDG